MIERPQAATHVETDVFLTCRLEKILRHLLGQSDDLRQLTLMKLETGPRQQCRHRQQLPQVGILGLLEQQ